MIRKHLETIVYLTFLIASAVPYALAIGAARMPFWLAVVIAVVWGTVVSFAAEPLARTLVHRLEDRAFVRSFPRHGSDESR